MRALILRHGRVNRRVILGFSPIAFIWLAMSLRGDAGVLVAGISLALILSAVVMLTQEAMNPNLEQFILSLPVGRVQLVRETYVSGLLALALGQVLPILMNALGRKLVPTYSVPLGSSTLGIAAIIFFLLAVLIFLMLPFRFAFGGQRGLMSFSILLVLLLAGLLTWKGLNGLLDAIGSMGNDVLDHPGLGLLGALGVLAFGALSLAVSTRTFGRVS